ncbi:MAG: hypothetical protein LBC27_02100, partial [Spirochaetaceae bacterium]|nr:hypothetical protein [Spirochaetaceae bacterium]
AIALVTKAVGGAVKAQKEFSDNVKLSYKAQAALADTLGKANKGISGQQKGVAVLSAALRQVSNIIDGVKKGFEGIANVAGSVLSWIANETGLMSEAQQEAAVKAQLLKEQNNALVESYEANKAELKKFKPR